MNKNELEKELEKIWQILLQAKQCFYLSFYLYKPKTQDELDYLTSSIEFKLIRETMWKMGIIELGKLFIKSDNHKFNLHKFLNKLTKNHVGLPQEQICKWRSKIDLEVDTVSMLQNLRDKLYAHTDREINFSTESVTFEKFEGLFLIVEQIIKEIFETVFNGMAEIDCGMFDIERFNIIKILANERKTMLQEYLNAAKQRYNH